MRARGWLWLLLLAVCAGVGLRQLRRGGAIQTDLLAMLPDTEKSPLAEQAIRQLSRATGDRAVFLVGGADGPRALQAASRFQKALEATGAFPEVQGRLPPLDPGALARFYLPHRFRLPPPPGLGSPDGDPAGAVETLVQSRLASPFGALPGLGPAEDPLGHVDRFLSALPLATSRFEPMDGWLGIRAPEGPYLLVTAGLRGSAFLPEVQAGGMAAVEGAERELRRTDPEARILRTGALFYASDARRRAEWETGFISWSSLACIVAMGLLVFRSPRHLLLVLACLAAGLVVATAACFLLFGQLYLLTLVCGSSLLGVAVDYAFLYFAHHLGAGEAWEPRGTLRRLLPPLLLGFVTTLLGYAALMAAPFPGLRQIAVFSVVGLAASFLTVLLLLPDFLGRPLPRPRWFGSLAEGLARGLALFQRPAARAGMVLAAGAALAALPALRVDDDVRGLIQPAPSLLAQEARIRELTGLSRSSRFFLVEGESEAQVLEREEALRARLEPHLKRDGLEGVQGVSAFVPSPRSQAASLRAHRLLAPALGRAMGKAGFRPEAISGLGRDLEAPPLGVEAWLRAPFSAPFRMLWLGATPQGRGSILLPLGDPSPELLQEAARDLPGVHVVDKARSVSALLGHYRRLALGALGGAVLLVGLLLGAWYGPGRGAALLAPALFGMAAAPAALAAAGLPLTLFGALGLILVLGMGVDYAVFVFEGGPSDPSALLGVLLASFATLCSFGLLAFSSTPALRGFGLTLAFGVLGSVLLAPLALREPA